MNRYFSDGCIRVENIDSLAKMFEPGIIPFLADSSMANGQLIFPLKHKIPIFILYELAWPDQDGHLRFFEDVYRKR